MVICTGHMVSSGRLKSFLNTGLHFLKLITTLRCKGYDGETGYTAASESWEDPMHTNETVI